MYVRRRRAHQRPGSGVVWPDSGTASGSDVRDPFGPRPFAAHVATVGYDYDFHRGADVVLEHGDPVYSVIGGAVTRLHRTHFGWESASQLDHWTETDPSSAAAFARTGASVLGVTGSRVGSLSFPTTAARWTPREERVVASGSWELRMRFTSAPSLTGGRAGLALHDPTTNEYVAIEYDGSTVTVLGVDRAGNLGNHNTTVSTGSQLWVRLRGQTGSVTWGVTSNSSGSSWVNVSTRNGVTFTEMGVPRFVPTLYWRSTDTNAAAQAFGVDFIGWNDELTIDRFGNWLQVAQSDKRVVHMHFQDIEVSRGQIIDPGTRLGTAGSTGFDDRSGVVQEPHVHVELIRNNDYFYSNDEPVNPLTPGFLPRTNVSNNVTVTRSDANDPDGVSSFRLRIQVARQDQDFDLNEVALTGSVAARRVNFDTRGGLAADNDVPKASGVYIVPVSFNESSSTYELSVYFNKSVVGNTFTAARVTDCSGNLLWSE